MPQKTAKPKTPSDKKELKPTEKPKLDISIVPRENIPKLVRRHTGTYAEIGDKLKELKDDNAIKLTVATRPAAAGLQKYFKPLGWDVVSRTEKDTAGNTAIVVFISKAEVKPAA